MTLARLVLATILVAGGGLPVALSSAAAASGVPRAHSLCAPPDDTVGPVATKIRFSKSTIDLDKGPRAERVVVKASDTSGRGAASGVARIFLEIHGNRFYKGIRLHRTSGTRTSGTWTGRFTVSKYARPGTYSIGFLFVTDRAGNEQDYAGYGKVAEGPNSLSLHPALDATFRVTGTPAQHPPRKPSGKLSDFRFTPTEVNTTASERRVRVNAKFAGAQPVRVYVEFDSVKKSEHTHFVFLHKMLHRQRGTWTGSVLVPRWLGKQTVAASVNAQFGQRHRPRFRQYDSDQLQALGFPGKLTIISGVDHSRPVLKSISFSPNRINSTTGPERVTVTARATDTGSGVRAIDITGSIRHGINGVESGDYPRAAAGIGYLSSDDFRVRLKQTANGDWVGTTTIRQCVPSGTYKLSAELRDAAGNYHFYSTKKLAKKHLKSTVKVTSKHGDVEAPYVFSGATLLFENGLILNFSEGVANVNTSTLTVYPMSPAKSRFTKPAAISGIACYHGKRSVDCSGSAGLVTSAVLTVPGLKEGKKYQVYGNQNQVVPQLTDGNRNPMDWNNSAVEVQGS